MTFCATLLLGFASFFFLLLSATLATFLRGKVAIIEFSCFPFFDFCEENDNSNFKDDAPFAPFFFKIH